MSRHDSRRPKFLLLGPIEEVATKPAIGDDDGTQELVDELEQILAGGQAALPSPDDFDDYDDPPFAPRRVVTEAYDPYRDAYGDDVYDDDDGYYDDEVYDDAGDERIEAVDYWLPAPYGAPPAEQRRLPPPAALPPPPNLLARRIAYAAGIAAIFVVAAAGAYFAFKLTSDPAAPATEVAAAAEPVTANAVAPAAVGAAEPAVAEAPAAEAPPAAADEGALAATPEPTAVETTPVLVNVERIEPRVAAEPFVPAAAADEPAAAPPETENAVAALAAPPPAEAPAPVITTAPVTEFGVTTAWVNLRTGPSNTFEVIGVVASGAEIGIVSCERWCEVEANGARGWIHSDYVLIGNAPEAVAELVETEAAAAAVAAPFTANADQTLGIYDSPFEDGAIAETVRNGGEIFIVGCDVNWCETRFGDNRRGWVDRRLVQMPADITDALIPPLPAISREEAAALKAAAL